MKKHPDLQPISTCLEMLITAVLFYESYFIPEQTALLLRDTGVVPPPLIMPLSRIAPLALILSALLALTSLTSITPATFCLTAYTGLSGLALAWGLNLDCGCYECFTDITASAFSNLVLTFNPDAIVLGGGISKVEENYHQIPKRMPGHLFRGVPLPEVLPPRYGDASGVRGATILGSQL